MSPRQVKSARRGIRGGLIKLGSAVQFCRCGPLCCGMYRQGDVLIAPVSEEVAMAAIGGLAPVTRDARGRLVLALGEASLGEVPLEGGTSTDEKAFQYDTRAAQTMRRTGGSRDVLKS